MGIIKILIVCSDSGINQAIKEYLVDLDCDIAVTITAARELLDQQDYNFMLVAAGVQSADFNTDVLIGETIMERDTIMVGIAPNDRIAGYMRQCGCHSTIVATTAEELRPQLEALNLAAQGAQNPG